MLGRVRAGDAGAREALFARHAGRLRLYVRHRLGRALLRCVEPDDVVQETYLRAVGGLERFDGGGDSAFFRFLCALARHVVADVARAARAQKRSARHVRLDRSGWSRVGIGESAVAGSSGGPLTRILAAEDTAILERAFLALPARYRRVIALRQLEGRSARDVAAVMGSTEGAIHALFRRALTEWGLELERLGGAPCGEGS
ncbi:MAG: sigma-70 family RNA polymerase sigma factor [Planctomycetes bacterium]|nr:sigma-70 family RNA polymerase sigma factor [Planctomycetota bacterium]MBI3847618.1 sigma-70 family RNA polymerase sigma factor [Planctomycetota bacterium]